MLSDPKPCDDVNESLGAVKARVVVICAKCILTLACMFCGATRIIVQKYAGATSEMAAYIVACWE